MSAPAAAPSPIGLPKSVKPAMADPLGFPLLLLAFKAAEDAERLMVPISSYLGLDAAKTLPSGASESYTGLHKALRLLERSRALLEAADMAPVMTTGNNLRLTHAVGQEREVTILGLHAAVQRGLDYATGMVKAVEELAAQRSWTLRTT